MRGTLSDIAALEKTKFMLEKQFVQRFHLSAEVFQDDKCRQSDGLVERCKRSAVSRIIAGSS